MADPCQLLALLLCLCSLTLVCSFNLEPRIPIVKRGSPKSHFGYTVAQHQTILDTASGRPYKKSWLLVGAPKDQNLQPGTNRSGALWKCPLTTYTTDCEQVKTDGFKDPESGLYDFDYLNEALAEPSEDEIKDDQWLGVTLKSQGPGGKVLVCAHRYMHKGRGFQWGFGLCYVLSQTLDVDDYLEPCRGKPVNEGHQQYGFCQAGTSGLLLDDEAVLGVPGPYTWRGTVHTSNISDNFLLKDKTQYFGPVTENDSPVDKYSYLGYSVTAGRFFGNYMSYVGGAPRANETGQVVFFSREKIGESLLRVDLTLQGEMFASSYGFEVLGVDINGDRRDDLIVGAPFYYTPSNSGAIYVYMNNEGGFTANHPYKKIEGPVAGESRFGFSMTSLGDLNHDGYKDIAIGAPYEGRGAIYIYLGSRDGLIEPPSQVIHAEDMPGIPYDAFGYSLSGGMDLDGNGYPDLLTSSFCSDRVLLIRARPVIDIQTEVRSQNLENIDHTRKGCTEDISSPETCFSFDACFKMDNDAGTKTGLRLKYHIEEISDRPIVRVRFGDSQSDQPNIVQRDIVLRPEDMGVLVCSREIVYLLDGPRNILQPLKFKLSYEIIQREPRPVNEGDAVPDIDDYPILNQQEAVRHFEGTFAKDCGDDDLCVSNLDVKGRLDLQKHEKYPRYILRLGEQDTVSLHVEVTNTGEPAYQSSLLVTHHQALRFDELESKTGSHKCSSQSKTQVQCSIGNPLLRTSEPLILSFKESGLPFDSKYIQFTVAANSTSAEETPQAPLNFLVEVIKKAEISIIGSVAPEQAFYGGEVVGESAIKHMDQVGMEITHKYVVDNRGPWRVDELQVEVLWPHQVENNKDQGKWLLYMTEIPTVDGVGECEIDPSYVNPLILRHQPFPESGTFTGFEVEGELETTDLPGPGGRIPSESESPTDVDLEASGGGVKITKTVSTTKKVTSSTTIKKQTSKTSSSKDLSISTERTSQGFSSSSGSSSSGGFSSSSSGSSSSDLSSSSGSSSSGGFSSRSGSSSSGGFSSSGFSETGPVDDEIEGSGFGLESGRQHGRTHSRVSRRVYSTEHKSRFPDSHLGVNELDSNFDDEDGDIVSHHEESHSSTNTSPDGKTTFTESHHESRKVIVKEGSIDDIPSGRWSQESGHHRTNTGTSSSDSASLPESGFQYEEDRRTQQQSGQERFQGGIGIDDETEGSGSYIGFDKSGQNLRAESGIHKQTITREETIRRTHSGGVSRGFGSSDRDGTLQRTHSDVSRGYGPSGVDETTRTQSGGVSGGSDSSYREETTRKTFSGDFESSGRYNGSEHDSSAGIGTPHTVGSDRRGETFGTHTGRYDGDESLTTYVENSGTRREGSRIHYSDQDRRITDGSERTYDHDQESSGGSRRYEGSSRTDDRDRSRQSWSVQGGTRRVTTVDSSEPIWRTDGDYRRVISEDTRRISGSDDSSKTSGRDDFSSLHVDGSERQDARDPHRGASRVDGSSSSSDARGSVGSSSSSDARGSAGSQGFRRTYSSDYDRTSSTGGSRTNIGGYDRTPDHDGVRTDYTGFERSEESIRTHSGQDRPVDGDGHRATFDWNSRRQGEGRISGQERGESTRTTHFREYDRLNQESTSRDAHNSDVSKSSTHSIDGGESSRHHSGGESSRHRSGGAWRSSGSVDGGAYGTEDSRRTSHTGLRTTTFDLNAGAGEQNRARWSTHHSSDGARDHSPGHRDSSTTGFRKGSTFGDVAPDENGTYTRVEVDPETGATTVYTKKVYSRNWKENWDRRPYNERFDSVSSSDTPHTRSRRELTRIKREKELIIKPQAVTDAQTGKTMQVVNLRCDGDVPTAKCFVFRCNIRNLGAKQAASIRIKSRLWNSTLVEDYPRVSYVSIKSKAALVLPEDIRNDQDQSDDVASAETLAYPDLLDQLPPEEVPLWVILVSIFAGLLVLIIIVLILWKLGFFERKRPDPTLSGNLDKDANGY